MKTSWWSLDQAPVLGLAGLLLLSWVGAHSHVSHAVIASRNPFVPVWVAYSASAAAPLVVAALAGLLLVLVIPLRNRLNLTDLRQSGKSSVRILFPLWVCVAVGGLALNLAARGEYLIEAPVYLAVTGPGWLVSLATTVQPLSIIATGVMTNRWRLVSTFLALAWVLILFAEATRLLAGVVILLLIGRLLGGGRVPLLAWLGGVFSVLVILPVPLYSRGLSAHGLVPYGHALWAELTGGNYLGQAVSSAAENLGFTIPLLVFTSEQSGITVSDIAISLNPGPGSLVGWDKILYSMRVHEFIPYSSLGEFASFGLAALIGWVFVWGFVIRLCVSSVSRNTTCFMVLFLAVELGLGFMSMLLITQYNTRAVARILGMMIAIALMERVSRVVLTIRFWLVVNA